MPQNQNEQVVDQGGGQCVEAGVDLEALVEVLREDEVALAIGDEEGQGEVAQEVVDSALAEVEDRIPTSLDQGGAHKSDTWALRRKNC